MRTDGIRGIGWALVVVCAVVAFGFGAQGCFEPAGSANPLQESIDACGEQCPEKSRAIFDFGDDAARCVCDPIFSSTEPLGEQVAL